MAEPVGFEPPVLGSIPSSPATPRNHMSEFRYKRFMRDGTTEERVAVKDPKRVRNGKTAKDNRKPNK